MLTRRSAGPPNSPDPFAIVSEIDLAQAVDFQLGPLTARPSTLQIEFAGTSKTIAPRVMQVMVALSNSVGTVVSRDRLVDLCWGGRAVSEDAINRSIAKVREVGAEASAFDIQTIPRVGYRLNVRNGTDQKAPGSCRRHLAWFLPLLLCVCAALIAVSLSRPSKPSAPAPTKVALVGFASLNSGTEAQHFVQSIDAAVSEALLIIGAEVVDAARPDHAARKRATFLVGGTVRTEGDSVRVTHEIKDATTGASLVNKDLVVPLEQAASVPDRVAASVADTINSWSWFLRYEQNPDRIASLIRIEDAWSSDVIRAYRLSGDLAAKAPDSGSAQFAFAFTTRFALRVLPRLDRAEALEAARSAARRARKLLPRNGDIYALDCKLRPPGGSQLTGPCDERIRQALAIDADAYFLPNDFANALVEAGIYAGAEQVSRRSLAVAPLDTRRMALRLQILSMLHRTVNAHFDMTEIERQLERYAPAGSNGYVDWVRYQTFLWAGDLDRAEAMLKSSRFAGSLKVDEQRPAQLMFKALRSRNPSDIQAARAACDPAPPSWLPPEPSFGTCLAGFQALDDLDTVFRLASHGYRDVTCCSAANSEQTLLDHWGPQYPRDYILGPSAAKMRMDPRYIDVARRTGLLAYWKAGHPPDFCGFERAPVCELLK